MPKIVSTLNASLLGFILLLLAIGTSQSTMGRSMIQIETGNHQSASWQFTVELSELWRKSFPELDTGLSPRYTSDIQQRFENLQSKNSRLIIAPLNLTANQIMLSFPVRLVTVLWEVYVVPIDIGGKKEPIGLNNYRSWYVSEKSVIIPELMRALNKPFFAETVNAEYEFRIPIINNSDAQTGTTIDDTSLFAADLPDTEISAGSTQLMLKPSKVDLAKNNPIFRKLAQIAGLERFDTEVLKVGTDLTQEIVSEYREGILFYEMMGAEDNLENALGKQLTISSFNQNLQDFIVSVHPWIQPVYRRQPSLKTLGYKMALFVHADEDPEFVENIIKVLAKQPKSYFPTSFIFSNLSIQKTKGISPIYLHAGSLKYFSMD